MTTDPARSPEIAERVERACEVMHDAYEAAAVGAGWETQQASRKPWADVPEANKATMRAAVAALLDHLAEESVCVCGYGVVCGECMLTYQRRDERRVSTRRTDWGIRDDATGNVGTVGAYNRSAIEAWLAELTEPSTLMQRERTTYKDDVTKWVPVEDGAPRTPPGQQ